MMFFFNLFTIDHSRGRAPSLERQNSLYNNFEDYTDKTIVEDYSDDLHSKGDYRQYSSSFVSPDSQDASREKTYALFYASE